MELGVRFLSDVPYKLVVCKPISKRVAIQGQDAFILSISWSAQRPSPTLTFSWKAGRNAYRSRGPSVGHRSLWHNVLHLSRRNRLASRMASSTLLQEEMEIAVAWLLLRSSVGIEKIKLEDFVPDFFLDPMVLLFSKFYMLTGAPGPQTSLTNQFRVFSIWNHHIPLRFDPKSDHVLTFFRMTENHMIGRH